MHVLKKDVLHLCGQLVRVNTEYNFSEGGFKLKTMKFDVSQKRSVQLALYHHYFSVVYDIIFLADSRGFFLRPSQSGKCIAAETLTFLEDGYTVRYWVEMVTTCLDDTALFCYLDK